jgi:hypothetical protein
MAVPAHQADGTALPVGENAKAVVLDFVNPARARRLFGRSRQAWLKWGRGPIGADPAPKLTHGYRH